ncbi:MAG: D-aminoacyl-tRNA deacylase [Acidimicrobiales bacterium]
MRAVVQRVSWARVEVAGMVVAALGTPPGGTPPEGALPGPGLCALVAVTHGDDGSTAAALARKLWHLRILADDRGRMSLSLSETHGALLVVSQVTLYGDTAHGRRPSWVAAAPREQAEPLLARLVEELRALGGLVGEGRFGAHMKVELVNDGPVTVIVDVGQDPVTS